ncbi:MAG: PAC2 family protein [Nocardioidaceae bacterium]|nr:PAC2 family protein [Nocardioidaceae bacterium]
MSNSASRGPRLVHIVDDVPELPDEGVLPLIVALDGFLDAGKAGALACGQMIRDGGRSPDGGGPVVATFDVDQFHDYRARRPPLTFARDHYEASEAPRLVVRLLRDAGGAPYLLLHGMEPDVRWEAFCRGVREVVERFGVDRVISIGSVPMAVPHTRPLAITQHANNPALLSGESLWRGELRVPSSAQSLLEIRLGEWGHDAQGFVAHVPHYLAQLDYPAASIALLNEIERAARRTIDLNDLQVLATERDEEITRHLASNEDVQQVVTALEQQYDTFARAEEEGNSLLAQEGPLPTGEEIGQQFEQFLAGLEGPDEQNGAS